MREPLDLNKLKKILGIDDPVEFQQIQDVYGKCSAAPSAESIPGFIIQLTAKDNSDVCPHKSPSRPINAVVCLADEPAEECVEIKRKVRAYQYE